MHCQGEWYQVAEELGQVLPHLRPAERRGLARWVWGTLGAGTACLNAVATELVVQGWTWAAARETLREWLRAGPERAAPCAPTLDVTTCFAPLLAWVLQRWHGRELALALDATAHGEARVVLAISVLYRGCALPVAWVALPGNQPGAWGPHWERLLALLAPAVPRRYRVLVLTDRGLWSRRLWQAIRAQGWHPLMRIQRHHRLTPVGGDTRTAHTLVAGPGHAWVGRATAFTRARRVAATALVVWAPTAHEPWVLLTDLPPERVGVSWYALRFWIELGFRALKGVGFQWEHTRRVAPDRVGRHWLVLAVAMHLALAAGSHVEDTALGGPPLPDPPRPRPCSIFRLGMAALRGRVGRGRAWRARWLRPTPWPAPLAGLGITYHRAPLSTP